MSEKKLAGFVMAVKDSDVGLIGYVKNVDFFRCKITKDLNDATIFKSKDKEKVLEFWDGKDSCKKDWERKIKQEFGEEWDWQKVKIELTPIYYELGEPYN